MALIERILGLVNPRISVHNLAGALAEVERGQLTRAQVIAAFGIEPAEEADLDALIGKITPLPEFYPLGAFVTCANIGTSFDAIPATKGLGFVAVDVTAITRVELRLRYNKQSAGQLTWQLWNDTDAQEIGNTTDATGAGDNKTAAIVVTPAQPLSGGVKIVRPRVLSAAATDDLLYYGSCLMVRRTARLAGPDLHEVLLLASSRVPPYDTVAAVRTRLGLP